MQCQQAGGICIQNASGSHYVAASPNTPGHETNAESDLPEERSCQPKLVWNPAADVWLLLVLLSAGCIASGLAMVSQGYIRLLISGKDGPHWCE